MNLRTVHSVASHRLTGVRSFLPRSACRHAVRTLSSISLDTGESSGVKSLRISHHLMRSFLLIARTSQIVTATDFVASTGGSTGCPSI